MKVASLFSGCGGLDMGLHQAGHELLLMCDSDAGARQVLRAAFPGVRIHDDVISLDRLPEETELLVAGFPCIDVSRAGLRRGLEGQSTGLVRHVFRLLARAKADSRPVPWVLLENVEALLDRHGGEPPVMQYCAQQLVQLGYQSWAYRVVNSAGFGVPNRRRRVFLVASMYGDARDVLLSQGSQKCTGGCEALFGGRRCYPCHVNELRNMRHHTRVSYALDMGNAMSPAGEDVVPTFTTCNDRLLLLLADGASGMLRLEDAERLQGLPEGHTRPCWPIQTPGVAAHRSGRREESAEGAAAKRWDLLGNAVTVPVARWLGERLAHPYQYKYHGVSTADRPLEGLLTEGAAPEAAASMRPQPLHAWSHVGTHGLQEAVLFEYLSIAQRRAEVRRRRARREAAAAAAEALLAGVAGEEPLAPVFEEAAPGEAGGGTSSGSEGEDSELEGYEGLGPEAAEVMAVVRAARKQAAAERAQQAGADSDSPTPPSAPVTPCEAVPPAELPSSATPPGSDGGDGASGDDAAGGPLATPVAARGRSAAGEAAAAGDGGAAGTPPGEGARVARRLARAEAEEEQKELFQAAIVRRKSRGLVQQAARQQAAWEREAWPRAAWYLRGLGCFGCEEMSECPVPVPFVPLGDFVAGVGREATQEEIHTYLHRMREKGWDVGQTIEKLLSNGARVSAEAHEIVRIPGLLTDADMIGDLVWVYDRVVGCWWPAEQLDPLAMPAGRDLPAGAVRALSPAEKLASLPQFAQLGAKLTAEQRAESRRVLVLYLPISSGQWQWYRPGEVEPFEGNAGREREACNLIKSNGGRWKHGEEMGRAIKDAKASIHIKQHRNCLEADRMRRARASAAAGAINLKQRCGQCKTCMNNYAGQRRFDCLTQRMKAAALSGHAGAQVAVNGEGAVGARVQVWWQGDQVFYSGILALYDAVSTEHTVCYDDGEVGMHRLWQHDERIRLASPVEQWPRDAALARHRLQLAQERLRNRDSGRRGAGPAAAAPPPPPGGEPQPYEVSAEQLRIKNREAFEVMVGTAARAVEANGKVPELTAEEREIVEAAQRAAREAAGQAAHRAGASGRSSRRAASRRRPVAGGGSSSESEEEAEEEEAPRKAARKEEAVPAGGSASRGGGGPQLLREYADLFGVDHEPLGRTRKRRGSAEAADGGGGASYQPPHDKRGRFAGLEKCGDCKYCQNPKLKKACQVVQMQRKYAGDAWRG